MLNDNSCQPLTAAVLFASDPLPGGLASSYDASSWASGLGGRRPRGGQRMVFPLYDENPLKFRVLPYATWGLIALNVFTFLIQASSDTEGAKAILASFGATPAAVF